MAQVLRRHLRDALRPRNWRMWPMAGMAVLSLLWVHRMLIAVVLLILYLAGVINLGPPDVGALMAILGSVTIIGGAMQGLIGLWEDRHYDPRIRAQWPWAACYPVYYWVLCTCSAPRGTLPGLLRRPPRLSTWNTVRAEEASPAGRVVPRPRQDATGRSFTHRAEERR
jgi:poly-beta-1,6-N-acetyl-D-glucosamine synthase